MRDSAIVIPISALRPIFVMLLVLIVLILAVLVAHTQLFRAGIATPFAPSAAEAIDRNSYEAVFLTNESTYFASSRSTGTTGSSSPKSSISRRQTKPAPSSSSAATNRRDPRSR